MKNNNNEEKKILLKNELWDDLSIENDELTVLMLLTRNLQVDLHIKKHRSLCSISMLIVDYMKYDLTKNRHLVGKFKQVIESLIQKKYIENITDLHGNNINVQSINRNTLFYVYLDIIDSQKGKGFFTFYEEDIDRIFASLQGTKLDKFSLIRYYIACMRVTNYTDRDCGFLAQSTMNGLINDSRTIGRYNKILQDDLHLIRFCNDYLTPDRHYVTTFISRYKDDNAEPFEKYIQEEVKSRGLVHTDKINSNKKRSVKAKMNNTQSKIDDTKNDDEKDKDKEIKELKAHIEQLKKKYKNLEFKQHELKPQKGLQKKKPENNEVKLDKEDIDLIKSLCGENIESEDWGEDNLSDTPFEFLFDGVDDKETKDVWGEDDDRSLFDDDYKVKTKTPIKSVKSVNPKNEKEASMVVSFLESKDEFVNWYEDEIEDIRNGEMSILNFFCMVYGSEHYPQYQKYVEQHKDNDIEEETKIVRITG